ncbi:MAG: type II secretion system protein [Rhodospirillaceae bacterium]|nr:type II secretion system protein [Rhodospirillaceae bacterium]
MAAIEANSARGCKEITGGFTLLEILVVFAIFGLLSVMALPQLARMSAAVEFAMAREQLEAFLTGLPYEAVKQGRDLILSQMSQAELDEQAVVITFQPEGAEENRAVRVRAPAILTPIAMPIPEGWQLRVPQPVIYRSTGLCTGGELAFRVGSADFVYRLKAPLCQPQPQ